MEGLGWWIYLCSVAGGILAISLTIFIVCLAALLITSAAYCSDECKLKTAKEKYAKTGECDCKYFYDEFGLSDYHLRYCGICGRYIGTI